MAHKRSAIQGRMFPKGDMGAGKQGPFWGESMLSGPADLITETPNGTRHSDSDFGMFVQEQSGLQEHQGALNSPTTLGSRGGRSGRKPAA